MNWLCFFGVHKWREERVLEQTFDSGLKCYLDSDVCQRCSALRDPENVADVYAIMANGPGKIEMHPSRSGDERE